MDPVTVAGLALAVVPLIISALENYEYTLQPFIIFSRGCRREVQRFQDALKVQKVDFENECCFLLHSVTADQGTAMIKNRQHSFWGENDLEDRLKARLDQDYSACISALQLINTILTEILKETKNFDIIQQKNHGRLDMEWLKRLRQRSKISFSKDRFDAKLNELEKRTQSLHKIRKHIEHTVASGEDVQNLESYPTEFQLVQKASVRLHEVLSSFWRCDTAKEHFANICLDNKDDDNTQKSKKVYFTLAWTCPVLSEPSECANAVRILVEACQNSPSDIISDSQIGTAKEVLITGLKMAIGPATSHLGTVQAFPSAPGQISRPEALLALPDLSTIPNLCRHLGQTSSKQGSIQGIGYLQKSKTFKHVIYAPQDDSTISGGVSSLKDALKLARTCSDGIPLPEKLRLAKTLAETVLRYHSTPWLKRDWQSQDIIFFGVRELSRDPLLRPHLKVCIPLQTERTPEQETGQSTSAPANAISINASSIRSPVRNQTLFSLGIMLIELGLNSPLSGLREPEDDQGDPHTTYWTAVRLGESARLKRNLGPGYSEAVMICLNGVHGASSSLEDPRVQSIYFHEVVLKLDKFAAAVSRFM